MSERKSIESSGKRYQTFITSERNQKNIPTAAAATLSPAAILSAAAILSPAAISPAAAILSPAVSVVTGRDMGHRMGQSRTCFQFFMSGTYLGHFLFKL